MTGSPPTQWDDTPPDPGSTIESLRSLGYTPGSAIADLVDNSIAAGARNVSVTARWKRQGGSWIAIRDNGDGMNEEGLSQAMRIGSSDPLELRSERDLGRFGFGLKTASFSQARELIVASRTACSRHWHARTWDLDHVRQSGRWLLRRGVPENAEDTVSDLLAAGPGTLVLWQRLTVLGEDGDDGRRQFQRHLEDVAAHLGMVFGRLIAARTLELRINNHLVRAWDPFLASSACDADNAK